MNNTSKHISDKAVNTHFDPSGTDWPANITNLQEAVGSLGSWARKDPGLPIASESTLGIARIATKDEVVAGTDKTKFVTSFTLNEVLRKPTATESLYGTTKYATESERMDSANNVTSITPKGLDFVFNTRTASEAVQGAAKVATKSQAQAGSQDNVMMTPLKVKHAIDALVQTVAIATESVQGKSKLATVAEIQAGTAREGVSISPYGFANARGTRSAYGTFKAATGTDVINGTAEDMAVTPKALAESKGSTSNYGIVALSTAVTAGHPNHALAANAAVLPTTGGIMTGHVYLSTQEEKNRYAVMGDISNFFPIGTTISVPYSTDGEDGRWLVPNGRWLDKNQYAALFARIGYHYGGDGGQYFAMPDYRGLFLRSNDYGRGVDPGRGLDLQEDMVEAHKHITPFGEAYDHQYFGRTGKKNYYGSSGGMDWDNFMYYSNDGTDWDGSIVNPAGLVGHETRPRNHSAFYLMRVL